GGLGNDTLSGDAGNDLLQGGEGQDQLTGGAGSDTLRGGAGADTYVYRPGDGEDLIIERDVPASPDTDVLRFGAGILPSQLSTRVQLRDPTGPIGLSDFVEQNLEFVHEIAGQGRVRVLPPDDMSWQDSRVEEIRFEDSPATVIRWGDTIAAMQLADAGNDLLLGSPAADTVDAQAGDDLLWGADGNDWLRGGEGRDSLLGGNGADTLDGGAGDDFLRGGNDPNPNNGLVDRYVWGRGYGSDTVWARPDNVFWTSGGMPFPADILELNGLQWSEIRAARIGADLELSIPGTADRVTVLGYFDSGHSQVRIRDSVGGEYRLDAVERKIVESAVLAQVSAGDDTIIGSVYDDNVDASTGNDRLEGRAGNDTLSGGAGNDVLDGGVGDDLLAGGAGNDDYRFTPGAGIDRILDQDKSTGRWDRIVVDGVAPSDIRVSRSADDLVLTLPGTGGQLTVAKHFFVKGKDIGWHVDEVRFADGSAWSRAMLQDFVTRSASGHWSLQGGSGADLLESLGGNDTLAGAAGADTLRGGGGEDRLIGGPGADLLAGGSGPDVYVFARGDGADTVIDEAGSTQIDVLEFGAGIAPGEVLAYRAGQSDLLLVAGGSDRIRVPGFFDGQSVAGTGVERIRFADGSEWRREDLQQAPPAPAGSAPQGGPDRVATTEGQPLAIPVSTLLANDRDADGDPLVLRAVTAISGGSVSLDPTGSTVNFTPSPYFSGAAAFDYLLSDGTSEVPVRVTVDVALPTGSTVRKGTEGADSLLGTRGDDRLYGLGGNDTLRADRGNDVLSGGRGNDTLEGSLGNDVYVFQTGDGADVIDNRSARSGEIDVLQLTDGITRDSLRFQRQADDLLIGIGQGG
ncbi:MAG: calcium-binding protein, partial [Gammaproteobacteria bacterium]